MKKRKTIHSFFKPIGSAANCIEEIRNRGETNVEVEVEAPNVEREPPNDQVENNTNQNGATAEPIVATRFERDPGKRVQILDLPVDQQDEARRFYISNLPVSTATTERCFSAMKLVKTRLRCTMGDELLRDCLVIYIEKELAASISNDDIITSYALAASRRAKFKLIDM